PVVGHTKLRRDLTEYAQCRSLDTAVLGRPYTRMYLLGNVGMRNRAKNSASWVHSDHITYRCQWLSVSIETRESRGQTLDRFQIRWSILRLSRGLRETCPSTRPDIQGIQVDQFLDAIRIDRTELAQFRSGHGVPDEYGLAYVQLVEDRDIVARPG